MKHSSPLLASLVFLLIFVAGNLHAKLGETPGQLVNRFGDNYSIQDVSLGKLYQFRSTRVSVDALIFGGISIWECYYSDKPLNKQHEPPSEIVHGVLNTNVPRGGWVRIDPPIAGTDMTFTTQDHQFRAFLYFKEKQPEGATWTICVLDDAALADAERMARSATSVASSTPAPSPGPDLFNDLIPKDERGLTADDYDAAAKEFEKEGDANLARQAKEKAASLRRRATTSKFDPDAFLASVGVPQPTPTPALGSV